MNYNYNPLAFQQECAFVPYQLVYVYNACVAAAQHSKKFNLISADPTFSRLEIKTKASLFSWGENMTVQLVPYQNGTEITVSAQPKTSIGSQGIGAQQTAGPKNKKNISNFLYEVSRYLQAPQNQLKKTFNPRPGAGAEKIFCFCFIGGA